MPNPHFFLQTLGHKNIPQVFAFSSELARERTDYLSNILRTYSNKDLSDIERISLYGATTAFLVQTTCKRLTTNEKDEEKLIKETLAGLKESIESNGGKKETIDMVEDIIGEVKQKLTKQKENSLPITYASSLVLIGIDTKT